VCCDSSVPTRRSAHLRHAFTVLAFYTHHDNISKTRIRQRAELDPCRLLSADDNT